MVIATFSSIAISNLLRRTFAIASSTHSAAVFPKTLLRRSFRSLITTAHLF